MQVRWAGNYFDGFSFSSALLAISFGQRSNVIGEFPFRRMDISSSLMDNWRIGVEPGILTGTPSGRSMVLVALAARCALFSGKN